MPFRESTSLCQVYNSQVGSRSSHGPRMAGAADESFGAQSGGWVRAADWPKGLLQARARGSNPGRLHIIVGINQ